MILDHPKYGIRPFRRHSLVLLMGGLIYIGYGISMMSWTPEGPRYEGIVVVVAQAPLLFWAWVWIVGGVLAVLSSRWPVVSETWGYTVLTGLATGWSATYFGGMFITTNYASDASGGFVWALVAFLWWGIAGLINPQRVVVLEVEVGAPHVDD